MKNVGQWKPHKIPELIDNIKAVVTVQNKIERSLYFEAGYVLKGNTAVSYDTWCTMTEKQRIRRKNACFRSHASNDSTAATSTDGKFTVTKSPGGGKNLTSDAEQERREQQI